MRNKITLIYELMFTIIYFIFYPIFYPKRKAKRKINHSYKKYEVLKKTYVFNENRCIINNPEWNHYKYYRTYDGALQAVNDFRRNFFKNRRYIKYEIDNGKKTVIFLERFKAIKRK